MKTIRNINETLGMAVTFTEPTVELAIARMLRAVQDCSPEMAAITELIEGTDYEIIDEATE